MKKMLDRTLFKWRVTITSRETGEVITIPCENYWSPNEEGRANDIATAACAAYNTFEDRRRMEDKGPVWMPISAERVKE